jgi:hypothetical protein
LHSDFKAIAKSLRSKFNAIARFDCAASAHQLHSDFRMIAQQLHSDLKAIAESL